MEAVEQGRWTYAIFLQPDGKCWGRDIIKALQAEEKGLSHRKKVKERYFQRAEI